MTNMTIRMNAARCDVTIPGAVFEFDKRNHEQRTTVCNAMKAALGMNVETFKRRRQRSRKNRQGQRKEAV